MEPILLMDKILHDPKHAVLLHWSRRFRPSTVKFLGLRVAGFLLVTTGPCNLKGLKPICRPCGANTFLPVVRRFLGLQATS